MRFLERQGRLNRAIEFLPGDDELAERKARGQGLTTPERAVLLAYCKMWLFDEILASDLPEDPWIGNALARYFPAALREKFGGYIPRHPLKREIVATHVLNSMVNRVGVTFTHRLVDATGARPAQVVRAYLAAREVFGHVALWHQIDQLDNVVADAVQAEMLIDEGNLTARATTWFLRSRRLSDPLEQTFSRYGPAVAVMRERIAGDAAPSEKTRRWIDAGVPESLAVRIASADSLFSALDVAEVADAVRRDLAEVAEVFIGIGARLGLARLRTQIGSLPSESHWQTLAKVALADDLAGLQRAITQDAMTGGGDGAAAMLAAWEARNQQPLERAQRLLGELADAKRPDLAMLSVALRELRNLA